MKKITPLLSGVILLILLGCSGGSPASPDSQPMIDVTNKLEVVNHQSNSHLPGLWLNTAPTVAGEALPPVLQLTNSNE